MSIYTFLDKVRNVRNILVLKEWDFPPYTSNLFCTTPLSKVIVIKLQFLFHDWLTKLCHFYHLFTYDACLSPLLILFTSTCFKFGFFWLSVVIVQENQFGFMTLCWTRSSGLLVEHTSNAWTNILWWVWVPLGSGLIAYFALLTPTSFPSLSNILQLSWPVGSVGRVLDYMRGSWVQARPTLRVFK